MVNEQKENILIADCKAQEVTSIAKAMSFNSKTFSVKAHISNFKRTGKLSELKRYFIYFFVALRYFLKRRKYDAIVGWQQFYTLIFCFYCSIFGVKKCNTIIALNFTYKVKKGRAGKIYRWFMERCVDTKYLDYIHVPSCDYAESFSKEFGFPTDRIIVAPFGINDRYDTLSELSVPNNLKKDSYALAIGRSNRDYDFLIDAWEGIDYPLVIICDSYKKDIDNQNITQINDVAGADSYPYIANCGLMIVPIDDGAICSGDTVLLNAMSLKKKIVVTYPSTLAEMYVKDKENALLSLKDAEVFKAVVNSALYSDEYADLGEKARLSFLENFSRESMGTRVSEFINR